MPGLGPDRSLPALKVYIDEIQGDRAVVVDTWGVNHTINISTRRAKGAGPVVGETWIMDRALGSWTLAACLAPKWAWRDWVPVISTLLTATATVDQGSDGINAIGPLASGFTVTPGAHAANHARWNRSGNRIDVDYSQLLTLTGNSSIIIFTLPVLAQHPRTVFNGDINAYHGPLHCTTEDGVDKVWFKRVDGFPLPTFSHFSFTGTYEAAAFAP